MQQGTFLTYAVLNSFYVNQNVKIDNKFASAESGLVNKMDVLKTEYDIKNVFNTAK